MRGAAAVRGVRLRREPPERYLLYEYAGGYSPLIELIAPRSESSPIWGLLRTYKNTPYHLCFESEALDQDVEALRQAGWTVFQSPAPAPAIGGNTVVFLVHRFAGIVELVEM